MGKNQQRLTENLSDEWEPSWSPDGKRIAFTSDEDGNWQIYVMDNDGKNQRKTLYRNPYYERNPSWSPDSKRVVFVSRRNGNRDIYVMNADGLRQVRRLTKNGGDGP